MADKKTMSVAEILAAARKADSRAKGAEATTEAAASGDQPAADPAAPVAAKPEPKPAASPGGGRPSVAEMLAMARGEKAGGGQKLAPKPKPKPDAAAAAKKTAPQPAGKASTATRASGPRETASILAAAQKGAKPGPMSKAEAAALKTQTPKPAKKQPELPPMPLKPPYAERPSPRKTGPKKEAAGTAERRGFLLTGFIALGTVFAVWALAVARFMFPNVVREPPSRFKVGFPDAFPPGSVETKFKAQYGVWIVNTEYNGEPQISALKSVCTHLGCTPNWLEAEQKFKCPCHGSGFYKDGINFEGPAPRPLERYAIRIADDGQIEVDKSRIFQEEMGQWTDPSCFIPA